MIKVEATIRQERLEAVKEALHSLGVKGLTITDVRGVGQEKPRRHVYRGTEYLVRESDKVKVEVVVVDIEAPLIARAIMESARTGAVGDGRIFLVPVCQAFRIRTGDTGERAID